MESKKFIRKPSPYSVSPVRTNWLRRPFIGCICGRFKKVRRTRPNCSPRTMVSTHTILLSDQNVCVYILAFDDLNAHNGLKILKHTHNGLRKISTRTKTLPINVARHTKNVVTQNPSNLPATTKGRAAAGGKHRECNWIHPSHFIQIKNITRKF